MEEKNLEYSFTYFDRILLKEIKENKIYIYIYFGQDLISGRVVVESFDKFLENNPSTEKLFRKRFIKAVFYHSVSVIQRLNF